MERVYRVQAKPLLQAIEDTLKTIEKIELPKNHDLIKTGFGKQYSPQSPDWFYARMAAIVRLMMCKGKVSRHGLAYRYGNRKNRGVRPTSFAKASDFVNLSAIKQLENIEWFNFDKKGGDVITDAAKTILTDIIEKIEQQ